MPYVDRLPCVLDVRDETVLVAGDVEHGTDPNNVGGRINLPDIYDIAPLGVSRNPIPGIQGRLRVGMFRGEGVQSWPAYHIHRCMFTYCELPVN